MSWENIELLYSKKELLAKFIKDLRTGKQLSQDYVAKEARNFQRRLSKN